MSAEAVDLYRTFVTALAGISLVVNAFLVPALLSAHRRLGLPTVGAVYAAAAAGTNAVSIYFRVRDGFINADWTVGDFTALVPTVGFLVAGLLTWRALGRRAAHHEVAEKIKKGTI